MLKEKNIDVDAAKHFISQAIQQQGSISLVSVDGQIIGAFAARDIIKKTAIQTIEELKNGNYTAGYNIITIPLAAGILYPSFGWSLNPENSALLMSMSSIIVALNAISLKFIRLQSKN